MNWFTKLFNKGKYEIVFSTYGNWKVNYGEEYGSVNKYCNYNILYNDLTKHYKLECEGYQPLYHNLYPKIFKYMRKLNEGTAYIKGGEIYLNDSKETKQQDNSKSVDTMNETECNIYLAKALKEENYELAEQIKKRLKNL